MNSNTDTKNCTYCSKEIPLDAKKCAECGEYLEGFLFRRAFSHLTLILSLVVSVMAIALNVKQFNEYESKKIQFDFELTESKEQKEAVIQEMRVTSKIPEFSPIDNDNTSPVKSLDSYLLKNLLRIY